MNYRGPGTALWVLGGLLITSPIIAQPRPERPSDSNSGSATSAVLERRKWRREGGHELVSEGLRGVKFLATDQGVKELTDRMVFLPSVAQHLSNQRLIAKTNRSAERVLDEREREAAREVVRAGGGEVLLLELVFESGSVFECRGRIDRSSLRRIGDRLAVFIANRITVLGSPSTDGIEVLQDKADRIDLVLATGALTLRPKAPYSTTPVGGVIPTRPGDAAPRR